MALTERVLWHHTSRARRCTEALVTLAYSVRPNDYHRLLTLISQLERNMYLAEDRILCFEIVTKKREAWVYVDSIFRIGWR